jgi:hypothetical protein
MTRIALADALSKIDFNKGVLSSIVSKFSNIAAEIWGMIFGFK